MLAILCADPFVLSGHCMGKLDSSWEGTLGTPWNVWDIQGLHTCIHTFTSISYINMCIHIYIYVHIGVAYNDSQLGISPKSPKPLEFLG